MSNEPSYIKHSTVTPWRVLLAFDPPYGRLEKSTSSNISQSHFDDSKNKGAPCPGRENIELFKKYFPILQTFEGNVSSGVKYLSVLQTKGPSWYNGVANGGRIYFQSGTLENDDDSIKLDPLVSHETVWTGMSHCGTSAQRVSNAIHTFACWGSRSRAACSLFEFGLVTISFTTEIFSFCKPTM